VEESSSGYEKRKSRIVVSIRLIPDTHLRVKKLCSKQKTRQKYAIARIAEQIKLAILGLHQTQIDLTAVLETICWETANFDGLFLY
jgi:hypothetical protein